MDSNVDKTNFVATILIILLVSVPLALYPESGARIMQLSSQFVATNFGWLYLLAGVSALVLLLWLAFGRYGKVKLGTAQDQQAKNQQGNYFLVHVFTSFRFLLFTRNMKN